MRPTPGFRTRGLAATTALALLAPCAAGADPVSAWRAPQPQQPAAVVVRNATIWTSGPQGVLEGADLVVRRGKIAAVGFGLAAPAGALVVDGAGLHVTPGLIDAHSHTAIAGGVNEGSHSSTAEVRIADVVDPDDVNIYRQLAGGLTAANLLHGSANAIGGQNALIKLRWGASAEEMLFAGAPAGIKFALGENPKQSNWNVEQRRYPQTRMGVQEVIRARFQAARDYARVWEEHRSGRRRNAVPPRRDLELEALLEILDGKRLVHSHSYRADEILMLIRLAEELGFRVATFQHGLEAYKVADELASHGGGGASIFSDWWGYKYEVIDAIPWAGAILHEKGVQVSFNSDSSELARRMNLEAAKAVRYGGVAAPDALAFVTLHPARQLGVGDRVGSLEPGKDADFVLWSGHPLSTSTICLQTWIDGRKYFDRVTDLEWRAALEEERAALIAKVRAAAENDKKKPAEGTTDEERAPEAGAPPTPEATEEVR
jgi:imidazolonepropionase-like amidohydrolase